MKKNDLVGLKLKTRDELLRKLSDLRGEVDKAKNEASAGKAKNTNLARIKQKEIAQVLTFLAMKEKVSEEPIKKQVKKEDYESR